MPHPQPLEPEVGTGPPHPVHTAPWPRARRVGADTDLLHLPSPHLCLLPTGQRQWKACEELSDHLMGDHHRPGLGSKERQRRSNDKDKKHPSPQSFHTIMNLSEPSVLFGEDPCPYSTEEETEAHRDSTTGAQGNPANAPGSNLSCAL